MRLLITLPQTPRQSVLPDEHLALTVDSRAGDGKPFVAEVREDWFAEMVVVGIVIGLRGEVAGVGDLEVGAVE